MNDSEINKILYSEAKELKMCDSVHRMWYEKTFSPNELASIMYANLDFCINTRWPNSVEFRNLFDIKTLRENGIVADDEYSLYNPTHSYILGKSFSKIRYNGFSVCRTTIIDSSECEITAKGHTIVTIHLYDRAKIKVTVCDNANVLIIRHSSFCTCDVVGNATIKNSIS